MEGNRAVEAERWLGIAEKLLAARDLQGCKTFAIRARESDPRKLRFSDQIIAVADVLIAGEARINNQRDWYAVLQLSRRTQDPELVAAHYRRLALLLNPDQNRLPFADQAFRLVADAWSVLSNQSKKALYDDELSLLNLDPTADSSYPSEGVVNRSTKKKSGSGKMPNFESAGMPTATETESTQYQGPCFWTACPYCYNLYEYPTVYEDCVLRCQNCQRAFHAVSVPSPPAVSDKDGYFSCWGFFPLGFSFTNSENAKTGGYPNWVPFSPMFACPSQLVGNQNVPKQLEKVVVAKNVSAPRTKTLVARRSIVIEDDEDDEEFIAVSDPSDDSDDEWGNIRKKKKAKSVKAKGLVGKVGRPPKREKGKMEDRHFSGQAQGGSGESAPGSLGVEVPSVSKLDTSAKEGGCNEKKQPEKGVKELGKLDLNVEFSNEVEEAAVGMNNGNGEEDNIEGISFFEGLDEFLSSLPILSVVGDDKVKAA